MKMRLEKVCAGYGKTAVLHHVSAELAPGAVTFCIGPNGAGKSTLLRLLSGFLRPTAGMIFWDDRELRNVPAERRARNIGVVSQMPPPALGFTVRELVELCARPRLPRWGKVPEADEARLREAMRYFEVEKFARTPANQLSGGELARTFLAGAAALAPEILLLDEPTAALDPAYRRSAMAWCENYAEDHAVLFITHDLELAARAKRVWLVGADGTLQSGTGEELLTGAKLTELFGTPALVESSGGRRRISFASV